MGGDNQDAAGNKLILEPAHSTGSEQAEGKTEIDLRSNIYSLGCVLYHMLSGHTPYEGGNAAALMAQHASAPPPDIRLTRYS